jgi:hypothetical protein
MKTDCRWLTKECAIHNNLQYKIGGTIPSYKEKNLQRAYFRSKPLATILLVAATILPVAATILLVALLSLSACTQMIPVQAGNDTTPPVITVWYGDRQIFGAQGLPQKWVNILGNISDPQSRVSAATFALNGGQAIFLRLGPDERRLLREGDFNIEIDISSLVEGDNHLEITSANEVGLRSAAAVTVEFHQRSWPLPYRLDWSQVSQAQEALQIIDGHWAWDTNGIRPVEMGYDRLVAIGDMSWTNFEITVQFTLHGIDPTAYQVKGSPGAGFGIGIHWVGHTDEPVKCNWPAQPHCGWEPIGGHGWYSFKQSGIDTLAIEAGPPETYKTITTRKLAFGHTYTFKMRCIDQADGNAYFLKVWEQNVENEPAEWSLQNMTHARYEEQDTLDHGSILLALHRVDATIGNITVTPIEENP